MFSIRCNRWTFAALALAALVLPGSVLAQTPEHPTDSAPSFRPATI